MVASVVAAYVKLRVKHHQKKKKKSLNPFKLHPNPYHYPRYQTGIRTRYPPIREEKSPGKEKPSGVRALMTSAPLPFPSPPSPIRHEGAATAAARAARSTQPPDPADLPRGREQSGEGRGESRRGRRRRRGRRSRLPAQPAPLPPPALTAAVAFLAAGTMAGSGADMLLPHMHGAAGRPAGRRPAAARRGAGRARPAVRRGRWGR